MGHGFCSRCGIEGPRDEDRLCRDCGMPEYDEEFFACTVEGCDRPKALRRDGPRPYYRPLCEAHYTRRKRHGDVLAEVPIQDQKADYVCSVEGCYRLRELQRGRWFRSMCPGHRSRLQVWGEVRPDIPLRAERGPACEVPNCDRPRNYGQPVCGAHWQRLRTHGSVRADIPVQERKNSARLMSSNL